MTEYLYDSVGIESEATILTINQSLGKYTHQQQNITHKPLGSQLYLLIKDSTRFTSPSRQARDRAAGFRHSKRSLLLLSTARSKVFMSDNELR